MFYYIKMRFNFFSKLAYYILQKSLIWTLFITNWKQQRTQKWQYIPDHPYKILLIGGFGSRKTNALLNFIKEQDDIDKFSCM